MTDKAVLDEFLAQPALAVVGVSRDTRKFGSIVYKDLKKKGYRVFAVNPNTPSIDGDPCYPSLAALPEPAGGAVLIVPPAETEKVVQDAKQGGISRIWLQPGAESAKAVEYCQANGIQVIKGECILMFAGSGGFPHNIHKLVNRVTGKLPR